MPANDCVGLHNYECRSPILPDMRKQNPKPSVARRQAGPFVYALEDRQLLPESQILQNDGLMPAAEHS